MRGGTRAELVDEMKRIGVDSGYQWFIEDALTLLMLLALREPVPPDGDGRAEAWRRLMDLPGWDDEQRRDE
jgi:hypothetical protein